MAWSPAIGGLGVLRAAGLTAVVAMLIGCDHATSSATRTEDGPVVQVALPATRDLPNDLEFPGRVAASQEVRVVAPTSGLLIRVTTYATGKSADFQEGALVQKGDVLFVIARNIVATPEFFAAEAALAGMS